jgi:protein-disulfide isomerase
MDSCVGYIEIRHKRVKAVYSIAPQARHPEIVMNKSALFIAFAAMLSAASVACGYYAGQTTAPVEQAMVEPTIVDAPLTTDTAQIESIVRAYLLKNPEIIVEVQTALETKRDQESKVAQADFLTKSGDTLFASANDAIIGNPKGDVTVVEFFDYNCGYCRRALGDMDALVAADPNVRFVLKELPILGPDSVKAHIVAQSFRKLMPEKYGEFHRNLLNSGHADEASAITVATLLGADEAKLRAGMGSPEIGVMFDQNNQMAQSLNITGTPSYVIKDSVVPGALGLEVLMEKVANVRKCQSATC